METIEVEAIESAPRRRWRPPPWRAWPWRWIGTGSAIVAGILALDAWGLELSDSDGESAAVDPSPAAGLTARQETMILHHFWMDEVSIAACMDARGFAYVPDPDRDADQLATVAGLLEIEPAPATSPLPAVLNARQVRDLDAERSQMWTSSLSARVAEGGCDPTPQLLYIDDQLELDEAIAAARADEGFEGFVAQALALDGDPVAQLRAAVLVDGVEAPGAAPEQWADIAERVELAVNEQRVWIVSERLGTEEFVDVAGLTEDGEALLVRVSSDASSLLPSTGPASGPVLECGPYLLQVAFLPSADQAGDDAVAGTLLSAMSASVCAP